MHKKTLNCSIHWSTKHRQHESNKLKVNNTATKHSLCPGNGVCLTLTRPQGTQFCTFMFSQQQKHDIKKAQNILKIKKHKKTRF